MFKEFKVRLKTNSKPSKAFTNRESNENKYDKNGYDKDEFNRHGYNRQGKKKSTAPIIHVDTTQDKTAESSGSSFIFKILAFLIPIIFMIWFLK